MVKSQAYCWLDRFRSFCIPAVSAFLNLSAGSIKHLTVTLTQYCSCPSRREELAQSQLNALTRLDENTEKSHKGSEAQVQLPDDPPFNLWRDMGMLRLSIHRCQLFSRSLFFIAGSFYGVCHRRRRFAPGAHIVEKSMRKLLTMTSQALYSTKCSQQRLNLNESTRNDQDASSNKEGKAIYRASKNMEELGRVIELTIDSRAAGASRSILNPLPPLPLYRMARKVAIDFGI